MKPADAHTPPAVAKAGLRRKLIRAMVLTLTVVTAAMLVTVGWFQYKNSQRTLATVESHIRQSIARKGQALVDNHALALRGLVADNAFSDVARLVEQVVREDNDVLYGLFLSADGRPWAYVSPTVPPGTPAKPDAWRELGIDPSSARVSGLRSVERRLFEQDVFQFSAAVQDEDGLVHGRIYYGISAAPLASALAEARRDSWRWLLIMVALLAMVGLGGTGLGLAIIRGTSSRIVRPLSDLTVAAAAISGGKRDVRVTVESDDEVGALGRAFNQMVSELDESHRTLEDRVEQRTQELAERNRDMRLVLDNVNQGFLTLSRDGTMASERSAIVDRWFAPYTSQMKLWEYVAPHDPAFAQSFELGFEALIEELLPREVLIDQLPRKLTVKGRHLSCTYFPIVEGDQLAALLVVVNDVTEQLAHARQEAEQKELVEILQGLMRDRAGFFTFFTEATRMVDRLRAALSETDGRSIKTLLHTLKGNAAQAGLVLVAELCHRAEDQLAEGERVRVEGTVAELCERWRVLSEAVSALFGQMGRATVDIPREALDRLIADLGRGVPPTAVVSTLMAWRYESAERPLRRLAGHAQALARRLKRGELAVEVQADDVRLDEERWGPLFAELVHVVRNAVDHGIEDPEERTIAGKAPHGRLRLGAVVQPGRFIVEIEDDGRGVNWEAVRAAAVKRGLPSSTEEDLVRAIFAPDLSTRSQVSATSGRGIGLAAVEKRVHDLNGTIAVITRPGQGTCFRFSFAISGRAGVAVTLDKATLAEMPAVAMANG